MIPSWLRRRLCWLLGHDVAWRETPSRYAHLRLPGSGAPGTVMRGSCLWCPFTDVGAPPLNDEEKARLARLGDTWPELAAFGRASIREPGIERGVRG